MEDEESEDGGEVHGWRLLEVIRGMLVVVVRWIWKQDKVVVDSYAIYLAVAKSCRAKYRSNSTSNTVLS